MVAGTSVEDNDHDVAVTKNAGESLELGCDVNVDPKIAKTLTRKWTKDGSEVGDDLLTDDGGLSITYLVSENAGEYTCHVTTVVDSLTLSRHVTVVTEAPRVTEIPARLGGMEGDSVTIECQASGIPVPDVTFKLGDEDVSSEVTSETRDNNTRVAHLSVSQAGTYTCLAVNMYGNDR